MRLDKFLKVSRIIKRRSVANTAADNNRVLVNGKNAKPGKEMKIGDEIAISFGSTVFKCRVLSVSATQKKDDPSMYEVIE